MIQIAICDDENIMVEQIETLVNTQLKESNTFSIISKFNKGANLIYEVQEGAVFDLMFLDIEMGDMSGMDVAKIMRELLPNALIIFVTSHYKYALDAYELNVFRYIPKNQISERLPHALKDAISLISIQNNASYVISNRNMISRILLKDITYITKEGKNSVFHTKAGGVIYTIRKSLTEVYEELSKDDFYMVDRSCIINLTNVKTITNEECILLDESLLYIATSRMPDFKKKINEFWRTHI